MDASPHFQKAVALTNRCSESKSPYVRAHALNPTAWQLWSPETIELARTTNRLLFVSIGYSACHWCHVMEDESFNNQRIAQLLNRYFIPIKIDREERPDIDKQYMDFLQATSGGGGWPLNVFVTPELQPLYGGTYWPGPRSERAQTHGVNFEQILLKISQAWREQESRCRESANQITQQLREFTQEGMLNGGGQGDAASDGLELDVLDDAFQHYRSRYDPKHGGFGAAPKFPTPVHIRPLLRVSCYNADVRGIVGEAECATAQSMAVKTLEAMFAGGIKDQIGHGFARYSVTRDWSLPHFEKMLYDNAQLLPVYLDAYLVTKSPKFLDAVHDIARYIIEPPIRSSLGGFHSSEDADSLPTAADKEKREGAYYTWTQDEFVKILGPEAATVCARYWGVRPEGNVDSRFDAQGELAGQNTLCVQYHIPELAQALNQDETRVRDIIQEGKQKLVAYRTQHRPQPALDDKIVTAWNGIALGGLARASAALRSSSSPLTIPYVPSSSDTDPATSYLSAAIAAATCIRTHLFSPSTSTLLRVYREGPGSTPGFADDYAFLIAGLIDLYEATFDPQWLHFADTLQTTQNKLFYDHSRGGFYSTPADQQDILVRTKDAMDNAEPSVNGVSAANLFRLASLLADHDNYEHLARRTVACFEVEIGQHPGLLSGLLSSVVAAKMGVKGLMVILPPASADTSAHGDAQTSLAAAESALRIARESVRPNSTVLCLQHGPPKTDSERWLRERNPLLKDLFAGANPMAAPPATALVQICEGTSCRILGQDDIQHGSLF